MSILSVADYLESLAEQMDPDSQEVLAEAVEALHAFNAVVRGTISVRALTDGSFEMTTVSSMTPWQAAVIRGYNNAVR